MPQSVGAFRRVRGALETVDQEAGGLAVTSQMPVMTTEAAKPTRPRSTRRKSRDRPDDALPPLLVLLGAQAHWRGLVVPARPIFVRDCRAFAAKTLEAWHYPELVDAVEFCASELATNAMCYGDGDFIGIGLVLGDEALTLEAYDKGVGEPFVNYAETNDEYGRGMAIVLKLSDDWGVDTARSFTDTEQRWKRVWCRFKLPK